jgi:hypothetical protein
VPQNARGGEEVVGAGPARASPVRRVLTDGFLAGREARLREAAEKSRKTFPQALKRVDTRGSMSELKPRPPTTCRAVHAWAQYAPVCTWALMMVVLREPTPSPEFSTERERQAELFFLA